MRPSAEQINFWNFGNWRLLLWYAGSGSVYVTRVIYRRDDVSLDPVNTAKFLAFLVTRLSTANKAVAAGGKKADPVVHEVAAKLFQGNQQLAWHKYHMALLSTVHFVALHFEFHIRSANENDSLHKAMQVWHKRIDRSSHDYEVEVYNLLEEKGGRLAGVQDTSFVEYLESAVHIESIYGLASPFSVPVEITDVSLFCIVSV